MWNYPRIWTRRTCLLTLCLAILASVLQVSRADDLRATTSLKYVPADAAFYSASLRNREQMDAFLASNAYQKLRSLPLLTFALGILEGQWQNADREEVRVVKELWEREENQQLFRVLGDAVSREIFVYGDVRFGEMLKVAQEIQRIGRAAQIRTARNEPLDDKGEQQIVKSILEKLTEVKIPGAIVGFRVSDAQAVESQITRLEQLVGGFFEQHDDLRPLKDRLRREKVGDTSFLTLSVDGSLIPWEKLPEDAQDTFDDSMRDALKKIKFKISLGVKDGYALLAFGESTDHLQRMGKGKLLIDQPEMDALRKHADRRIVGVGYASRAFLEQANSTASQIDDMVATAESLLPLAQLGDNSTESLLTDVRQFATELKTFIPKPGAMAGFSYLTDRGYEGYEYNWGQNMLLDGSRKLDVLNHVGGDPVAFVAGRHKYSAESYDWFAKWLGKAWHQAEQNIVPKLNDDERKHFEQVRDHALPLVKRFDKATRDHLLPALRDGEGALVIDAKARSKHWHQNLPSTRVELPMFEIATVYGVSDAAALKRAAAEYFAITQEALNAAHELAENNAVPKVDLPAPDRTKTDVGEVYSYAISEPLGLDAQIAPNAGLSADTLVLSFLPEQTKRLLKPTPLKRPLAESDRPLAAASYCNFAGLFDAITPWVNFGVRIAGQGEGDNQQVRMAAQMVAGNVTPILDLLKCLGEHSSVTYVEGDTIITHSVTRFADAN